MKSGERAGGCGRSSGWRGAVAVIVPLGRWTAQVGRLVDELLLQCDTPGDRVVLVDWGELSLPEGLVGHEQLCHWRAERPSIACQRNLALSRLAGEVEWVALIDSDALPDRDWICSGISFLMANPPFAAVGGPELVPEGVDKERWLVGLAQYSPLLSGHKRHQRSGRRQAEECNELSTANLIARLDALLAVGGFDERLMVGEDSALSLDLIAGGWRLYYQPDQRVFHLPRRPWLPLFRQRITLGYGIPPLLGRYLRQAGPIRLLPELLPLAALLWITLGWLSPLPQLWVATIVIWTGWIVFEGVRLAPNLFAVPTMLLLIASGNLLPGVGTLLAMIGVRLKSGRFYRNDQ